ncbi:MAG: ABC transporter permease [Saprospiraceae bacterium]
MNKHKRNIAKYIFLGTFVFIGIFADFIANDKAIIARQNGHIIFPIFSKNNINSENQHPIISPIIKYSFNTIDLKNAGYVSPFGKQELDKEQQRHFLGTDLYGRDVLAGLIHGTQVALIVGFGSMFLAFIIGMLMSLFPSYYSDKGLKIRWTEFVILIISLLFIIYISVYNKYLNTKISDVALFFNIFAIILFLIKKLKWEGRYISLPMDTLSTTTINIIQALPSGFLVIVLISLFRISSMMNIILVIGLLVWPTIARYIRAEVLKVKEERFIESSKILGLSDWHIVSRHILPYTLSPVLVALSYGFAGTILMESTLSFLSIGTPAEHVSWGTLLSDARQNMSAWWLAVFPGLAIFLSILLFNSLASEIKERS